MGERSSVTFKNNWRFAGWAHRSCSARFELLIICCAIGFNSLPAFAQSASLGPIEQKLFFKTYDGESDESRVNRIETNLFGQPMQGPLSERMSRIMGAAAPQANPDGSISGMSSQQSSTTNSSSAPTPADLKRQAEEEREAAMQRAKVAVQAAKDEQTSKYLEEGVNLWRSHRGTDALQYFEQALKVDPHNASALYYAGIVYESKKNYTEALASYRKAADEDPTNQEYANAVMAVQKIMNSRPAVDPRQAEIAKLATEANDAYKRGEYLSALDLYKQLDAKSPNQALVKYNLGMLYLQAHHYQTALQYLELAVKLRPTDQKFQNAYQQLKASVSKSEADAAASEAAWAGQPGMGGSAGGGNSPGTGTGGGVTPGFGVKHFGHEAMNTAAHQQQQNGMPQNNMNSMQPNGMPQPNGMSQGMQQNGMQQNPMQGDRTLGESMQQGNMQQGGMQQGNMQQNAMQGAPQKAPPKTAVTMPGTGKSPGLSSVDSGAASLNQWAQVQNASKAAPAMSQGSTDISSIPAGQHPLVRHPLHSSSGQASSSTIASNNNKPLPFQKENQINFNKLEQPTSNALMDLGIMAADSKGGVTITHVGIASRASKAGLLKGDYIRAVDNKVITSYKQLLAIIKGKPEGATINLHVQRKDQMGVVHL
jgi:tetratricopeptide (TPR) repeat protein